MYMTVAYSFITKATFWQRMFVACQSPNAGCDEKHRKNAVASELGTILNISELYISCVETWHEAGLGTSLGPFDCMWWTSKRSDTVLLLSSSCPLHVVFGLCALLS